ncbi:ABC transporter permease [Streptomyces sp. NPDC102467]|uniref:ABC transporter permease n=1 Tax=Streptomyces sp. NPDC102467 TaxID=3366179 RepID=UPI0038254C43
MSIALTRPKGLTWTVLRLHRIALGAWIGYVAVAAGLLLWLWGPGSAGLDITGHCVPGIGNSCTATGPTADTYRHVLDAVQASMGAVPLLAAVFTGGMLIGRELEHGTAQLAWTQSMSPVRWLTAKLTLPALLLTVGTGLLVALRHAVAARAPGLPDNQWYVSGTFDVLGTTAVALPLLGLACGALGALWQRKALPAAGFSGVLLLLLTVLAGVLRPHLWPTVTATGSLRQGYPGFTGDVRDEGAITGSGAVVADPMCGDNRACLTDRHITGFYTEGHPPSHFWPLQLVETGLLLLLAGGITFLAFRILRRRVAR